MKNVKKFKVSVKYKFKIERINEINIYVKTNN